MPPRRFDGDRLRRTRRAADLTQGQLADEVGVGAATVGGWEAGRYPPDQERLPAIAHALGEDLAILFPREEKPDEPDLVDLRCDAGYFQYQTKEIIGTKSARPVTNAERGQRRLSEPFVGPLAAAYGVSEEELLAAQERSFGNAVPPTKSASREPGTLAEKINYLLDKTYPGDQRAPSDAEIAHVVNEYAGAAVATEKLITDLRSGEVTECSPVVRAGLADVFGVQALFFEPGAAVVRQVVEGLQLLARQGPEGRVAARGLSEEGLPSDVLARVNEIVAELQQGRRGPASPS